MKKHLKIFLLLALISMPIFALATGLTPGSNPLPSQPEKIIPLDGGVSLLIAAGVGYGIKKYRDSKLKK